MWLYLEMVYKEVCVSVAQLCLTLCDPTHSSPLLCPWNSPGKNTGVGSDSLLQGIFPIWEFNLALWHCRQILYCLRHLESPYKEVIKVNEVIRVGAGSNRTGILIRRGRGTSDLSPPPRGKARWRQSEKAVPVIRQESLTRNQPAGTLTLDLGPPELWEDTFLLFMLLLPCPVCGTQPRAARDKYNRVVSFVSTIPLYYIIGIYYTNGTLCNR